MNDRHRTFEQKIFALTEQSLKPFSHNPFNAASKRNHIVFHVNHVLPSLKSGRGRALQHYMVTQDDLRQLMIDARTEGFKPARLERILASREKTGGEHLFAVVINGAYWDTIDYALPTLQAANIPCTILVSLAELEWRTAPWWHLMPDILAQNNKIAFDNNGKFHYFSLQTNSEKEAAFSELAHIWNHGDRGARTGIANMCHLYTGKNMRAAARRTCLPPSELVTLAEHPLVQFGLGTTHTLLQSGISLKAAAEQLFHEKTMLENYINQPMICSDLSALNAPEGQTLESGIASLHEAGVNLPPTITNESEKQTKSTLRAGIIPMLTVTPARCKSWQKAQGAEFLENLIEHTQHLTKNHKKNLTDTQNKLVIKAQSLTRNYISTTVKCVEPLKKVFSDSAILRKFQNIRANKL